MAKSKAEVNFMEHLKPLLPAGGEQQAEGEQRGKEPCAGLHISP